MHSSTRPARRRLALVGAAVLVSLATTACDPAALDGSALAGDAAPAPGATGAQAPAVPTPVPLPPAPVPGTPAAPPAGATSTGEAAALAPVAPATATPAPAPGTAPVPTQPAKAAPTSPARRRAPGPAPAPAPAPAPVPAPGAPAPAPAPAGSASSGAGGSYTDQARQQFRAANGQVGQYLLYAAGIDASRPVGLVVYLDGTGEYGVNNPGSSYALGGPSGLVATAKARNMITLAVESPNQSCECWHTGDTTAYADFLAQLIETQLGAFPVDEVWLSGFSSGAQEITRFLIPRHPELMRLGGGWVVFGGGGPPADGGANVTAARMAGVRGHWFTGTADTAVPLTAAWGAQAGERWYAARGVVATHDYPTGVGHALDGRLGRTVGAIIDAS
ncbi:hypothetical protein [Blastococcus sp. SYSU D01042]